MEDLAPLQATQPRQVSVALADHLDAIRRQHAPSAASNAGAEAWSMVDSRSPR
jgi:hypothetical protein